MSEDIKLGKPEKINYRVVSEFAGDRTHENVPILEAAQDIFNLVKEKAMEVAVQGKFLVFETVGELVKMLETAAKGMASIKVYDANYGG